MTRFQRPNVGPVPRRQAVADHLRRLEPRRVLARLLIGVGLVAMIDVGLEWRSTVDGLGTTIQVVSVRRDVPAGRALGPDDVHIVDWPFALAPDDFVSRLPPEAIARTDLVVGEVLVSSRLFPTGNGLRAGDRLVTVPMPAAPPPVHAGSRIELYGIRSLGGDVTTRASRLTVGIVVDVTDVAIAVAVPESAVPVVLDHLAFGVVDLVEVP